MNVSPPLLRTKTAKRINANNWKITKSPPFIADALSGKTLEQQLEYYYVTDSLHLFDQAYGKILPKIPSENVVKLSEYDRLVRLLLKGHILVGAVIRGFYREDSLLPNQCVCTHFVYEYDTECYDYLILCAKS